MDASSNNMFPMIDKAISEPLTDNRTAETLKHNIEGLIESGRESDVSDLRYIKLNKYEQEEMRNKEIAELEDETYAYD